LSAVETIEGSKGCETGAVDGVTGIVILNHGLAEFAASASLLYAKNL